MSLQYLEERLSEAALWVVNAVEPAVRSVGVGDSVVLAESWVEFLLDVKQPVLMPLVVFALTWLVLRLILRLTWRRFRLGALGPWWKSYDYIWLVVLVIAFAAVTLDNRRANLKAELAQLTASLESGAIELESRIQFMELRCLQSQVPASSAKEGGGPRSLAGLSGLRPTAQHCENAKALRDAFRRMRAVGETQGTAAGLAIEGPGGRTTWRAFAKEVERLSLHFPQAPGLSFLAALESRIRHRDDFGPGRTRWTHFGWMDRDLATIAAADAELTRLEQVARFLSGWAYLFAIALALRLVKTAAERRIERDRAKAIAPGHSTASREPGVVEHYLTARGGRYTYRVLSARQLSDGELRAALQEALDEGRVREPEAGGTATLVL